MRIAVGGPLHGQWIPLGVRPNGYALEPGEDFIWRWIHDLGDQ